VQFSKTAVFKRPKGGIWQNLYDLPLLVYDEVPATESLLKDIELTFGIKLKPNEISPFWVQNHILTHQKIKATFFRFEPVELLNLLENPEYLWLNQEELNALPVSRLLEKYLQFIYR
jgi:adenine-specific DNA glycosylase